MAQHWHEAMPPSSSDLNLCLMVGVTARYAPHSIGTRGAKKKSQKAKKRRESSQAAAMEVDGNAKSLLAAPVTVNREHRQSTASSALVFF